MKKLKISRAKMLELKETSKFQISLDNNQKEEFYDLSVGLGPDIDENRRLHGELSLYETLEVKPTLADLLFVRELTRESPVNYHYINKSRTVTLADLLLDS